MRHCSASSNEGDLVQNWDLRADPTGTNMDSLPEFDSRN